jgi:hypothetical protein
MSDQPPAAALCGAEIQERLRAFLLDMMSQAAPHEIAAALMYEHVSILASVATSEFAALTALKESFFLAVTQIGTHGIGHPHP